ncbi:MAG: response regulator, partial [Nitrospinaceae bacterium]|nr:response regulator [Nitrospinaceae bacterium]
EMMDGRIWVESEEGHGSRFYFTVQFEHPEVKTAEEPEPSERGLELNRLGLRVLLAEDNPVNQLLARRILEKLACQVVIAKDGKEAVAAHEHESLDLILMDGQMPNMDGFEATVIIRDREKATGAHIPIIALTAHAMEGDRERFLEAGMDAYLAKPFTPGQLVDVINQIVS